MSSVKVTQMAASSGNNGIPDEIGPDELRRRRNAAGFSRYKLAVHVQSSITSVSAWENGLKSPSIAHRRKLNEVLPTDV